MCETLKLREKTTILGHREYVTTSAIINVTSLLSAGSSHYCSPVWRRFSYFFWTLKRYYELWVHREGSHYNLSNIVILFVISGFSLDFYISKYRFKINLPEKNSEMSSKIIDPIFRTQQSHTPMLDTLVYSVYCVKWK